MAAEMPLMTVGKGAIQVRGLRTQMVPIAQIKPDPRNARVHSAKQVRQIADSIRAFGFTNPLLVSEDQALIAGHGRLAAAELLGLGEVPVIVIGGLSPTQRRALAIADNRIGQNARWDRKRLAIEIPELEDLLIDEGLDISVLGFEPIEIERLQVDGDTGVAEASEQIDPAWCNGVVVSKPGDLWVLGDHRLMCGYACESTDIARLMGDRCAAVAFIDPPDETMTAPDRARLLGAAFAAAVSVSCPGATHFVMLDRRLFAELTALATAAYGAPSDVVAWVKPSAGEGSPYLSQHELIGVFNVAGTGETGGEPGRRRRSRSNVWHYAETRMPAGNRGPPGSHRALKPVALVADAIEDCTRKGNVVLDICSGWGTTVMAAEQVGRHARAMEADPRLVDAAIRRWQARTQRQAVHATSGLTFDEIAAGNREARSHRSGQAGDASDEGR